MPQYDPVVRISTDLDAGRTAAWDENLTDRVISFSFTDKARGADEIEITLRNNDGVLLDDPRLKPDAELLVLYGYPHLSKTARLKIKKLEGFWALKIKGPANGASRFLGSQKSRAFEDATEWEVAEQIATELGYTEDESKVIKEGDIAEVRRGITQSAETDWAFLTRLADRVDCILFVRDGVFHFHPPSLEARPLKEIVFFDGDNPTFIEPPNIEYGTMGRSGRTQAHGVSTEERAEVRGEASNTTDTTRPALGEEVALTDAEQRFEDEFQRDVIAPTFQAEEGGQMSVMPTSAQTDNEAERQARRRFRGAERESVKIEATLVGDPELEADETVKISGIGQRFTGPYLLDEVVHSISPSYKTKIKGRRNAVSRSSSSSSGVNQGSREGQREAADVDWEGELDSVIGRVNTSEPGQSVWDRTPSQGLDAE